MGGYLGKKSDGTDNGRIDLQIQKIWQLKSGVRQNQSIGRLTLTEPVGDQMSALSGIVWASKPEFLGTVDKKLRANLGLTYHLTSSAK